MSIWVIEYQGAYGEWIPAWDLAPEIVYNRNQDEAETAFADCAMDPKYNRIREYVPKEEL